jgi:hypothetical protein
MFSFRNHILSALALSVALTLPAFAADPAAGKLEKYLPDGADGVVTFNVRQLLDSELIKKIGLDKTLADEDAQKTIKSLGLDPLKDIERVLITFDKEKADEPFFIIQGKFDLAKLSKAAEDAAKDNKEHFKIHKSEYGKIYELSNLDEIVPLPPQAAGAGISLKGKSVFATIPDKGHVVLAGSKEAAEIVLSKSAGKKTTKLTSKELSGLLAKMDLKQSIAVAMPAPGGDEKVKSVTGGITVTSDVKSRFIVTAADADAAKQVDSAITEQLKMISDIAGLVVLQQKELAPAVDILNGIKHDAKDATVALSSDIKGETLSKLFKAAAELAAKQGGIK